MKTRQAVHLHQHGLGLSYPNQCHCFEYIVLRLLTKQYHQELHRKAVLRFLRTVCYPTELQLKCEKRKPVTHQKSAVDRFRPILGLVSTAPPIIRAQENNSLPFLDVFVEKSSTGFPTSVYHKLSKSIFHFL